MRGSAEKASVACRLIPAYIAFLIYGFTQEQMDAYRAWYQSTKKFLGRQKQSLMFWRCLLTSRPYVSQFSISIAPVALLT